MVRGAPKGRTSVLVRGRGAQRSLSATRVQVEETAVGEPGGVMSPRARPHVPRSLSCSPTAVRHKRCVSPSTVCSGAG